MEEIEFDLFSVNVRGITSITCFIAILDIIVKKQVSDKVIIQMQETKLNKITRDHQNELEFRGSQCFSRKISRWLANALVEKSES